jgi:hypothetical protein
MLRHDMCPRVTVSLEPDDAVFFWQDVVHSGWGHTRKTATTYVAAASDLNAGSPLKMR